MLTVLNDPAADARTRSGSDRALTASSAPRSTCPRAGSIPLQRLLPRHL